MLGSRIVTTYVDRDREYNVILQGRAEDRATPTDLDNIYVRSDRTGELVPLSNLVQADRDSAGPMRLNRFDRLRSITVSAALAPGYTLGEALGFVENVVQGRAAASVRLDYDGQSREFKESGGQLYWMFLLALVVVFLVLAAQFESFLHPLVIMVTVPLAVIGALVGLWMYGMSINVFSQIACDHAGRPRGQERHPDRRVRQPAARPGRRVPRGGDRGRGDPPAPGADDQFLHGLRRVAADARDRRRRRAAPGDRRGRSSTA